MNKTIELKPCPFCGSNDVIVTENGITNFVDCITCGTLGPDGDDGVHAAKLWNTRVEADNA